jgi:hypothetical protein
MIFNRLCDADSKLGVVDDALAEAVCPMMNAELLVMFYDRTTIRAEGLSEQDGEVRKFGMFKEGGIACQFMLGLVQMADGIPLYHEVVEGNTAEVSTLKTSLQTVMDRFPIQRVIGGGRSWVVVVGESG